MGTVFVTQESILILTFKNNDLAENKKAVWLPGTDSKSSKKNKEIVQIPGFLPFLRVSLFTTMYCFVIPCKILYQIYWVIIG